jgi:Glycosyl hydrolases family 35
LIRSVALLLAWVTVATTAPSGPAFVQAVDFPYYLYPHQFWERELVWLKTIGVDTVEFSIPWNWHEIAPDEDDFSGRTSPRRDLAGFIKILRKLGLRGWVRPMQPVPGWLNSGLPTGVADMRAAQAAWLKQLDDLLEPQTEKHGGPIAFVESRELHLDAPPPPSPTITLSATDSSVFLRSREVLASGHGALLWINVESALYPEAWEPAAAPIFRPGAIDLNGQERTSTAPLRRDAALLRNWARFVESLHPISIPKLPTHKLPETVRATELVSAPVSAVSVLNRGKTPFHGDLLVRDPVTRRGLVIPNVSVPASDSLWLPLNVSLSSDGLCRECSNFSTTERIIYSTAELLTVEFENGILAMEFAAPESAEVILQLAREPVGPYLAAGKPTKIDWDEKTLRAHLTIPASKAAGNRVRVGLAIEEPETSAFFNDAKRLTIGQKNIVSTVYSSADVAGRSRLRVPEGFNFVAANKSPNEIDYTIDVPAEALHGDFAPLTLEADGVPLGRARVQLFRPASIRLTQALSLHLGSQERLPAEPPTVPIETRGGTNLEIVIRNNSQQIQTYRLQAAGDGLDFSPAKTEISIGAMEERPVSLRVFGMDGATGVRDWRLHVTGGTDADLPMRTVLLPRAGTVAWTADLDGDGYPEWVLESAKVRAVFSSRDGRWIDFTWKDTDTNFLPLEGGFAQTGTVDVRNHGDSLEFVGNGSARTVHLNDSSLTIDQSTPLPAESINPQTIGNLKFTIERSSPNQVVYAVRQTSP